MTAFSFAWAYEFKFNFNFNFNTLSRHLGELLHRFFQFRRSFGEQLLLGLDHDADLVVFMHRADPHAHGRARFTGFLDLRGREGLHVDVGPDLVDDLRGASYSLEAVRCGVAPTPS